MAIVRAGGRVRKVPEDADSYDRIVPDAPNARVCISLHPGLLRALDYARGALTNPDTARPLSHQIALMLKMGLDEDGIDTEECWVRNVRPFPEEADDPKNVIEISNFKKRR